MQKLNSFSRTKLLLIFNRIPLFNRLTEEQRLRLVSHEMDFYSVTTDESIVREGVKLEQFYILLAGTAEMISTQAFYGNKSQIVPGTFIGELDFLARRPCSLHVNATSNCILLSVSANSLKLVPYDIKDTIKDNMMNSLISRIDLLSAAHSELKQEVRKSRSEVISLQREFTQLQHEYPHIRSRYESGLLFNK